MTLKIYCKNGHTRIMKVLENGTESFMFERGLVEGEVATLVICNDNIVESDIEK